MTKWQSISEELGGLDFHTPVSGLVIVPSPSGQYQDFIQPRTQLPPFLHRQCPHSRPLKHNVRRRILWHIAQCLIEWEEFGGLAPMGGMMSYRDFIEENNAARLELGELVGRLDERTFKCTVGSGWTVSTVLCHLAFWDQRVLFLLRRWQSTVFEPSRLTPLSVDSINQAATAIAQVVPGPAAARLALDSAAAVDSQVAETSDELAGQILSAGFERFLRRSLHRREHLQKIEKALAGQSV